MDDHLAASWLLPLLAAPFFGSFLGVLIVRLPKHQAVVMGRSACPSCGTSLTAIDLVPLLSFLSLGGRCRHCGAPIGWFHFAVELAAFAVALSAVLMGHDAGHLWVDCGLGWTLLSLAWIDWKEFMLPDVLTLPLLLAGLLLTWAWYPADLADHSLAAMTGYLSFQTLNFVYRRLRGRDGLGGGDAKLIAAAGAWLGLAALPAMVFGSAITGLLAALALALAGRKMTSSTRIPFGPCIALVFWILWLNPTFADALIALLGRS